MVISIHQQILIYNDGPHRPNSDEVGPIVRCSMTVFSGVMKHASPSGSPMGESGFGGCQENDTCTTT